MKNLFGVATIPKYASMCNRKRFETFDFSKQNIEQRFIFKQNAFYLEQLVHLSAPSSKQKMKHNSISFMIAQKQNIFETNRKNTWPKKR